jgi:excinuclease UvrABC ATPase subunit
MSDKSLELKLCPKCGSTDYLEDYPAPGTSICADCGQEIVTIKLREIVETYSLKHKCPFCGKEGAQEDLLYFANNITVYKCKGCEKIDGRWELSRAANEDLNDGDYSLKAVAIAEKEGTPIYSASKAKELAKALHKREKDPKEKCRKQFKALIYKKNLTMQYHSIDSESINRATWELTYFIKSKGPFTNKQLESLFSAAVILAQDDLLRMGKLKGNKITERQMEEIFNVDRKTTRKWKKTLKENRKPLRLIVYAHKGEEKEADWEAEIPKDLKSIKKLENPQKGKCDFCEETKLLVWQLEYVDGLWSRICQDNYERLKGHSLEEEWKIENLFK